MKKALEVLRRELQNNYEKRPFIINRELYHKERIEDFHEAIDELQDLKSRSCENCYESKTCKILHSVYKDRLKKEGYAMHKNEFKCGFWHSLF